MERDDIQLIRSTLSGNDVAFSTLVQKYQKRVHALAWRKIGDFHHAEEITQDTFLQAYKKLSTLKNPNQFAGWLYVIANRLCLNWMRKKKPAMQSLEGTSAAEAERSSYTHYVSEHRETEASEHRSEIVRKLLARLPESERTVMTLYYLGEMPAKEIGKFLGVSVKTVHSRLHRARKRLQEREELLISEVLGGVQLPASLMENITRQIANIKPVSPPIGKPLLPWAAFGAATVLIMLLLGASNQYLVRFQQPYSFEAQSEPTIEIVDAFIVVDIDAKPAVRHQVGRAVTPGKSSNAGLQSTEIASTSNIQDDLTKFSTSQWNRTNGPYGGVVRDIFVTSDKTLYAAAQSGIYRREPDATAWSLINTDISTSGFRMPMTEHGDTLYIVADDKILTSLDNGETWHTFCSRPIGHPVGFVITNETDPHNSLSRTVLYLALQNKGIFRSTDVGTQWHLLADGLGDKNIYTMAAVGNTLFAGTHEGLYRFNSETWQKLSIGPSGAVYTVTGFDNNIYVEMGSDPLPWGSIESMQKSLERISFSGKIGLSRIFYSNDLGASWTEITQENKSDFMRTALGMMILAHTDETFFELLLPQGVVAVDKNTFYKNSPSGTHRTTDSGKSWHPFINGIIETTIQDLVALKNCLYAYTGRDLRQSVNGGETWETVTINDSEREFQAISTGATLSNFSLVSQLATAGDVLYGIVSEKDNLCVAQLSASDNVAALVQDAPTFKRDLQFIELWNDDTKPASLPHNHEKNDNLSMTLAFTEVEQEIGGFAVSGKTFYAEYKRQLFKWNRGDSEWTETGLSDTTELPKDAHDNGLKLAASGETVYVGQRDGTLFQSLDSGKSWKNITPILPLRYTHLKKITFAGTTVYVATDKGVLSSQTGAHWRVLTDKTGKQTRIDSLAVDSTTVYGANNTSGIYRLDTDDRWKQIAPSVPDKIRDLAVNDQKLYIATQRSGIFHISLEAEQ